VQNSDVKTLERSRRRWADNVRRKTLFSMIQWLSLLPLDPRFASSNPAEDDGFLRAMKVRITYPFGGEVKPSAPCRKSLWRVKNPCRV
jgi:hypothetical protein